MATVRHITTIPDGSRCFVDANVFYYHFVETVPVSEPRSLFLKKVLHGGIFAFTTVQVLSDVAHKVMLAEASRQRGTGRAGVVASLRKQRNRIPQLSEFREAIQEIGQLPLPFVAPDLAIMYVVSDIVLQQKLLMNDATIIALMQRHGLTHLVTNDDDFDNIPGITVWKPR